MNIIEAARALKEGEDLYDRGDPLFPKEYAIHLRGSFLLHKDDSEATMFIHNLLSEKWTVVDE